MSKLMLIDATHPEETRVAVVANGQIEDFDFEARNKRQLRGNIYLAKVTRVEPSLQAAFVDYGGNRHGFLAFAEIHPDYYQIPKEDREALLAEADEEHENGSEDGEEDATGAAENGGDDEADDEGERKKARRTALFQRKYKIQEVIRRRQVMLIQVVKEERGNKGAALTTYLSLAGRYCVLMPNTSRGGDHQRG
jgi:ribonuclease E